MFMGKIICSCPLPCNHAWALRTHVSTLHSCVLIYNAKTKKFISMLQNKIDYQMTSLVDTPGIQNRTFRLNKIDWMWYQVIIYLKKRRIAQRS